MLRIANLIRQLAKKRLIGRARQCRSGEVALDADARFHSLLVSPDANQLLIGAIEHPNSTPVGQSYIERFFLFDRPTRALKRLSLASNTPLLQWLP